MMIKGFQSRFKVVSRVEPEQDLFEVIEPLWSTPHIQPSIRPSIEPSIEPSIQTIIIFMTHELFLFNIKTQFSPVLYIGIFGQIHIYMLYQNLTLFRTV